MAAGDRELPVPAHHGDAVAIVQPGGRLVVLIGGVASVAGAAAPDVGYLASAGRIAMVRVILTPAREQVGGGVESKIDIVDHVRIGFRQAAGIGFDHVPMPHC